jgi:sulfur carrier protein ThiS
LLTVHLRYNGKQARCAVRRLAPDGEGTLKLIYRDKEWELKGNTTLRDALKKAGLSPEAVLAVREGKLLTDDVILRPEDIVKLIAVVSGG